MSEQLGGFKNMLRQWRINLKRKKSKKQKISYKRIIYSALAILLVPIFYIFKSEEIKYIEIKNDLFNLKKLNAPKVTNEVLKIEKKIENKNNFDYLEVKKEIKRIKKDLPIEKKEEFSKIKSLDKVQIFNKEIVKAKGEKKLNDFKKNKEHIKIISTNENIKKNNAVLKEDFNFDNLVNKVVDKKVTIDCNLIKNVEKKILKKIDDQLNEMLGKINDCEYYNALYDYERDLIEVKKKIEYLESLNYKNVENKYNLKDYLKYLDELIIKQEKVFFEIEIKKSQLLTKDGFDDIEKNDIFIKEPLKDKRKKEDIKKSKKDFTQEEEYILLKVKENRRLLLEYEKKIKTVSNKKFTVFNYLSVFSTMAVRSLLIPNVVIKSKTVSNLVSALVVSNQLKCMKKIINKEKVNFELLQIKEKQEMLNDYKRICMDNLDMIESLKCDINKIFGKTKEGKNLLNNIEMLETLTINKLNEVNLNFTKNKNYVKVLKK